VRLPYIEVHMSNLEARGLHSVMAGEADGMITGLGIDAYPLALDAMLRLLARR
jgi:3-dehydroquinate dehydratase II